MRSFVLSSENKHTQSVQSPSDLEEEKNRILLLREKALKEKSPQQAHNPSQENKISLKEICLDLKRRLEKMKTRLAESEAEASLLRGQETFFKKLIQTSKDELDAQRRRLEELLSKNAILERDSLQLKEKLKEASYSTASSSKALNENQQLLLDLKEAKNQEERLKQRLEKYLNLLSLREKQLSTFRDYQTSFQKAQETIKHLESELSLRSSELSSSKSRIEQQEAVLEEKKKHGQQLERAIHFLRERNEEAQLETKNLEEELQASQSLLDETRRLLKDANAALNDLKRELQRSESEKELLAKEANALTAELDNCRTSIVSVKEENNSLLEQNRDLAGRVHELVKEQEGKHSLLVSCQTEIEALKKEKERVLRQHQASAKEVDDFKNRLEFKQQELERLRKEGADLATENQEKTAQIASLKAELARQQEEKAALIRSEAETRQSLLESEEERKLLEGQFKELKRCVLDAGETKEMLSTEVQEKNRVIERLGQELESYRDEVLQYQSVQAEVVNLKDLNRETEEKLKTALADAERSFHRQEALEREIESLHEIKASTDAELASLRGKLEKTAEALRETETHREDLFQEKSRLIDEVRSAHEKAAEVLEQKEEEHLRAKNYEAILNEKSSLIAALQEQIQELKYQHDTKSRDLDKSESATSFLQKELMDKQRELEQTQAEVLDKIKSIEELRGSLSRMGLERKALDDEIRELKKRCEEGEAKAQHAQQHLGKKVREATLLAEALETNKRELESLQSGIKETETRLAKMQKEHTANTQEREAIEAKLKEATHSFDQRVKDWEAKYFKMHEACLRLEEQNRALRQQKEKFDQMQSLLTSLGTVMGAPVGITQPASLIQEKTQQEPLPVEIPFSRPIITEEVRRQQLEPAREEPAKEEPPKQTPYKNLFDFNPPQPKMKSNFFD